MRVGQNPIKSIETIAPPAPVTVVVISYIPFLSGYYAESLDVLKLCLGSLHANTKGAHDVLVFDNGSCPEVREYLLGEQRQKRIQYLMLSERNVGKPAAWNAALAAAPGEFVAYADSDVYFYPGWLEASLKTLKDIPQAGMLTAMPMLIPEKYSTSTVKWANKTRGVKVQRGPLLSWDDFWRHARSLGDSQDKARKFYNENPAIQLAYKGQRYFVGAAHFQFTARKEALREILPIPAGRPMGQVRLLDEAMNKAGYLRLCTEQWHVQHLGNVLPRSTDLVGGQAVAPVASPPRSGGVWRLAPVRKLLTWVYGWSFDRLHRGGQ